MFPQNKYYLRLLASVFLVLLLGGCSSPLAKNYREFVYSKPTWGQSRIEIIKEADLASTYQDLTNQGFRLLGQTTFSGVLQNTDHIESFARNVGATLVVYEYTVTGGTSEKYLVEYTDQTQLASNNIYKMRNSAEIIIQRENYLQRVSFFGRY
ncbi:MAG: hypothetical protein OEX00_11340 [Gammaproteobacteria bacterium]|nr:hypothetical protein [Gammaproteobacteria bacterium]MDH5693291.1 hypothetical protein [Gammaproteobacteria bacterium]